MKKSWKTTVLLCAAVLIFGFSGCEADSVTPGNLVPTSYTVLIIQAANGTITASPIRAEQGATITLTASPASTAYQLKANSWSVKASDDTPILVSANTRTFTMPASDVTVTAEFEAVPVTPPVTYAVSVTQPASGGTVAVDKTAPIAAGTTVTVTLSPAADFLLKALSVKDASNAVISVTGSGNTYTFTMPASDVTVTAEFEAVPNDSGIVNVSLNAFYNGEISFDKDSVTLSQSEKTSVKISVEGVYESYSWIVDGKERSTAKTITLTAEDFNEQSNHNVSLVVYRDNIPYSASLVVTVTE